MCDIIEEQFNLELIDDYEFEYEYLDQYNYVENNSEAQEEQEYEDFYCFASLNQEKESLFNIEDDLVKEKEPGSLTGGCKSDTEDSVKSIMVVSFVGDCPDMKEFERLIQMDMHYKGANQMVYDALLDPSKNDQDDSDQEVSIKVKKRKSKEQLKLLEEEFAKGSEWTKEFMNEFADKINLAASQVYKWHWDQISKKLGRNPKKQEKEAKKRANPELNRKRKRSNKSKSSSKSQKTAE